MQVKVFESQDMASGLRMVRRELGPDALILSTRTIRHGKLGLLGKPVLEITAAIDDVESVVKAMPTAHRTYLSNNGKKSVQPERQLKNSNRQELLLEKLNSVKTNSLQETPRQNINSNNKRVFQEIDELKNMVRSLTNEVSFLKPAGSENIPSTRRSTSTQDPLLKLLLDNGISTETAGTISDFARESLTFEDLSRPEKLTEFLHETISGLFQVSPPDFAGTTTQQRIALVGPTGVGKTTTLAKIGASFLSKYSDSIALITIDTYRIAAVEQLKVYGEIMRLPVDVVITPEQLDAALEKHQDKDLILIDTAGRSPRDKVCVEELSTFLKPEYNIKKHLVLSAVTRESELLETIRRFSPLSIDRTIFTKIDECGNLGVLLNIQVHNPSPLSYITNGQRVPEDLLEIDREKVSRLVIPPIEGTES